MRAELRGDGAACKGQFPVARRDLRHNFPWLNDLGRTQACSEDHRPIHEATSLTCSLFFGTPAACDSRANGPRARHAAAIAGAAVPRPKLPRGSPQSSAALRSFIFSVPFSLGCWPVGKRGSAGQGLLARLVSVGRRRGQSPSRKMRAGRLLVCLCAFVCGWRVEAACVYVPPSHCCVCFAL